MARKPRNPIARSLRSQASLRSNRVEMKTIYHRQTGEESIHSEIW